MPAPSHLGRMVLYPEDPAAVPAQKTAFANALVARGLLGEHWRDDRYLAGHRFMQEIVFVGCSPFLRVEPREDFDFCHLQLSIADEPLFLRSADAGRPRCPSCNGEVTEMAARFRCKACALDLAPAACRWRPGGTVWARTLISVWTLQRGDARPTDALLAFLEAALGCPWKIAFLQP